MSGYDDCFLFVKLEKSTNFDDFLTYTMADGWNELEGTNGTVYYRVVDGTTNQIGKAYNVLANDQVTVKGEVTKAQMNAFTENNLPKLTITAYASQLYKSAGVEFTPAEAWANVKPVTP